MCPFVNGRLNVTPALEKALRAGKGVHGMITAKLAGRRISTGRIVGYLA